MNSQNIINTLLTLGALYCLWWFMQTRVKSGRLYIGKKVYDYKFGDDIESEVVVKTGRMIKFRGIDITLDKHLPHIYLDSHADSRMSGPRFYFPKKYKASLEGNFDKYSQLYAADGSKQLALSIISPDVMQSLIDASRHYDVEIRGQHLRLISQKRVFKKPKAEQAILDAAQVILAEIDHRLKSWKDKGHQEVIDSRMMDIIPEQTAKIGGHMVRLAWIICIFIGLFISFSWMLATEPGSEFVELHGITDWIRLLGVVISFAIPFSVVLVLEYLERKHPRLYRAIIRSFTN